jgi:multidrug resistance efflux pump
MQNTIIKKYQPELISNEVQEIVSYRPHWIIRKGNTVFFLIFALLLASTFVIKYPDVIKGSMKLAAIDAPKLLIARTEGKLEKLLVSNEQEVKQGQPLAFLQSTAVHNQVLILKNWISNVEPFIDRDSLEILLADPLPVFNQLGEAQTAYQDFQNTLKETLQILNNGYYQQKRNALLKDMNYLSSIQNNAKQQQQLLKQDYELQKFEYKANESLAKDKVIAPIELNQNKSKVIGKEQGLQQMAAQLINNNMAEHNKEKEILDLQKYITDQRQKFRSELFNLKSKVEAWIQQYVIIAPENGKVLFASFLQENQLVSTGQELFYVQTPESRYYGQLMVSQTGLGKIKNGQKVIIRVESYPSTEFGYITGVVNYISNIPSARDSFLIKVDLPTALRTNYNKTIFFPNNLTAQAEVITDDRKLFDRFLGQLKDMTKR